LQEVQGIAEGSGFDFSTMFAFQLLDEAWAHGEQVASEHCSSLGLARSAQQPAIVAQNMDLESFRDGNQVLLQIEEQGNETFVFTQAGLIALNGVNKHGVGVVVNTLSQLSYAATGLPVAFVIRGVLARSTVDEAGGFLRSVKHASGQNYIIGGPDSVRDFEASAKMVLTLRPQPIVAHTNHPLASQDYHPGKQEPSRNSEARYQSLTKRFKTPPSGDPGTAIEAALRSRDSAEDPVCRRVSDANGMSTFGSTIMILGGIPEIWVSAGPPDQHPYRRFSFKPPEP
jgi:isopenicillin-N N-acyltransferase-like protein